MNPDKIPAELKAADRWVIWGSRGEGKVPRAPKPPYRNASVRDLLDWGSFADALAALVPAGATGVGFVMAEDCPYVVADLDHCRDPASGVIEDWALAIIARLNSYTEISPSGTGVHIWVRALLPPGGNRKGQIELYCRRRYMTVTGDHLVSSPTEIHDRGPEIAELHREVFWTSPPADPGSPSDRLADETPIGDDQEPVEEVPDDDLLEKALASAHGEIFRRLWDGQDAGFPSASEADASLFARLAFWCNANLSQMERLARRSARARPKWDEGRGTSTWLEAELDRAAKRCGPGYRAGAAAPGGNPYTATPEGLFWGSAGRPGSRPQRLTNFTAAITAEIIEDDGLEARRLYELQAEHMGQLTTFLVAALEFGSLRWVAERLPATATVFAGFGIRSHVEVAIRQLSYHPVQRRVLRHTGWTQVDGHWGYAHAGGLIWRDGLRRDVEVHLAPALERLDLPAPPAPEALRAAVRAHLDLWSLAPDEVSVTLAAAVWRAVLGEPDFGIALAGPTGVFKSELAALGQSHFGRGFDARHLPASWAATANALETLAFEAKDAVLTVDDFAPTGQAGDVQALHRTADRLLRAQGNRAGRARLRADATLRPTRFPRGLVIMTGEDVPAGQSLRARIMILQLARGDIAPARLSICQAAAAHGLYAATMSAFLAWVAPKYEGLVLERRSRTAEIRDDLAHDGEHRRVPAIAADLIFSIRLFLRFAGEVGVIDDSEAVALDARATAAIVAAAEAQATYQLSADPAEMFCELVRAAIASGSAHLAARDGNPPTNPIPYGWHPRTGKTGANTFDEWVARGLKIGWIDGPDVYLQPEAAYSVAQRLGGSINQPLHVAGPTLHLRLHQARLLRSLDERGGKTRFKVRRMIEGTRQLVLHLAAETIIAPAGDPSGPIGPTAPPCSGAEPPAPPPTPVFGSLEGESEGWEEPPGPPEETEAAGPSPAGGCPWYCDAGGQVCLACGSGVPLLCTPLTDPLREEGR
ncbi:MAG: DUF927 domain-containing protein [Planctomycetales bacterium]|nr:DUF927 domain-containing protein [Planctomycetales bacterium]